MKRRNFITGIVAAIGVTMVPNITSASNKNDVLKAKITYETTLFKRFFFAANGFPPNSLQMIMFEQFKKYGIKTYISSRQTGMSTFMLTLALFEKKVNAASVLILAQNYRTAQYHKERLNILDHNTGKSVLDGIVDINCRDRVRVKNGKVFVYDYQFNMIDGFPGHYECYNDFISVRNSENIYDFGTTEKYDHI